jgi:hypothetical protein
MVSYFYYPGVGNNRCKIYMYDELYNCIEERIKNGYLGVCVLPSVYEYIDKRPNMDIKDLATEVMTLIKEGKLVKHLIGDVEIQTRKFKAIEEENEDIFLEFTGAYGPFHTYEEANEFKMDYESKHNISKYDRKIAFYNYILNEINRTYKLYNKEVDDIIHYWFRPEGPRITSLYIDIFHNGFESVIQKTTEYERKLISLNRNIRICKNKRNRKLKKLFTHLNI